jgi:Mor family transcriptional regulator
VVTNMSDADLVSDILRRVVAAAPPRLAEQLGLKLTEIELQVRHDWGGERVYICRRRDDPEAQSYISRRNAQIRREFKSGERVPLLARRHGVSERWIRKIVGE